MSSTDSGDPQILAKCNVCFTDPCQHGGTCQLVGFKQYSCQCTPGYHGDQCQHKIDACFGNPCENGGTCEVLDDYGRFRYTATNCLVAMVINCLLSNLPIMYAIILLLGVLLAPGIDSRPMLIFPLSLGSGFFLIVLICLIFCYIVLIRVDVSVSPGAFLSLAGILLFLFVLLVLSMSVLK